MPKACNDCGVMVHWTAFEVDGNGNFLRDPETNRSITHKCQHKGEGLGRQQQTNDGTMPFGKYKGQPVTEVVQRDRSYMEWAASTTKNQGLKAYIEAALLGYAAPAGETGDIGGGNAEASDW